MTPESAFGPEPHAAHFRHVLSHVPTGVVLVTALVDGEPSGMTIGSFTSISLEPPLVGFYPALTSTSWPQLRRAGGFCVNVLGQGQEQLAARFAGRGVDRFAGLEWDRATVSGAPIIGGVVAWIDCSLERELELGDHTLVVGRVEALDVREEAHPLVFSRGEYPLLTISEQLRPRAGGGA